MDRTQELEEQVRRLTQSVDEMRAEIAGLHGGTNNQPNASSSRRGFLRMGAAAAAGALGWAAVRAVPAVAATGGNMLLGSTNVAEAATTLQADAAITGGEVLGVESQNFSPTTLNTTLSTFTETFNGPLRALGDSSGTVEGIDAWAGGASSYAVWGLSDAGTGVTGEAITGIGLYSRGTGRLRQDPQGTAGLPSYSPNLMEQVRDIHGVLWIHNAGGVPLGAPILWRRVNTVRTDAADGSGGVFKPFRRVDTRQLGAAKAPGATYTFTIAGQGSGASAIPADAIAVVGNLTAVAYTGPGFLTIMPAGITVGTASNQYNPAADPSSVNFIVGQGAIANAFVCGLDSTGSLQVYVGDNSSQFIIDITAYIQ